MTATAQKSPVRRRRLLIGLGTLLVLLIGYTVYSIARPTVLHTELEIDASSDQVWKVLTDRATYPDWNPFIISSTGDLTVGTTITNVLRDTIEPQFHAMNKAIAERAGRD
jgi:hypothetical protein